MLGELLENVRRQQPLIHNITNYVTVNDVANAVLAVGARPVMADAPEEAADIVSISAGVNLNLGTLNAEKKMSIRIAGKTANEQGKPVVLDPVGAGASSHRTQYAKELLEKVRFTVIRGNLSEIKALAVGTRSTSGVDAGETDLLSQAVKGETAETVRAFSAEHGCVTIVTGEEDLVSDGTRLWVISNGRREMRRITGMGCMLSGITAAFLAANPQKPFEAAAAAVCAIGLAGETAWSRLQEGEGNASYRNRIIDALYHMTPDELGAGAVYKIY